MKNMGPLVDEILRLRALGLSYTEIGLICGVSRQRVEQVLLHQRYLGQRYPDPEKHPIRRLAEETGGITALARALQVGTGTLSMITYGRAPTVKTWERLRSGLDRIAGASQETLDEVRQWLETVRPTRVRFTTVTIPVERAASVSTVALRARALEAAWGALEDLRAGRPLRPASPRHRRGVVIVRLAMPAEDLAELREAARRSGRSLSSVIAAYMPGRDRSSGRWQGEGDEAHR